MSAAPARSPWDSPSEACVVQAAADSENVQRDFKAAPDRVHHHEPTLEAEFSGYQETAMPKFVIERDIPGAGKLTPSELKTISQKSCGVLSSLGPSVQW